MLVEIIDFSSDDVLTLLSNVLFLQNKKVNLSRLDIVPENEGITEETRKPKKQLLRIPNSSKLNEPVVLVSVGREMDGTWHASSPKRPTPTKSSSAIKSKNETCEAKESVDDQPQGRFGYLLIMVTLILVSTISILNPK